MAPHALARNARHPATSVCVNSVRTKPPAYELHEHQNELCYIYRDKSVPIEELVNPSYTYIYIYFIHALVKTYIHILLGLLEILCVKICPVDSSADSLISQRSHFAQSCRQRGFQELVVLLHGLMLGSQIPFFGGVVPKLFNLVSASGI